MALKGYTKQLFVDGVLVACITNITSDISQPSNEIRHKGNRNVKGVEYDQIDEQTGSFQVSGIFTDNTSNIVGFVDWLQGKLVKSVQISDGQNFGDRALFFDARCESDSETDQDLLKFDITLQSTGEITQGVITPPSLFTFRTNKVGTIFIQATGDNSAAGIFTDGFGNPLTMPFTRAAGDSEIIYMRGENAPNGLADFKTLTANNNLLYGDYDFSLWTSLSNAQLEGNNLGVTTFIDGQFNTGTLNVINSFVQGAKFTAFITAFDTAMSTPRASVLDVGTIDDPLLLDPSDQTGTYAAIQSLISKGWLISVVSNKLFTATIQETKTITPNATLSAQGSLLYTLNSAAVSNIQFGGVAASTFNVNSGDILECWYANQSNDLFGLTSVDIKNIGASYFNFEVIALDSSIIFRIDDNESLKSNIDLVLQDIESKTTTGNCEIVLTESIDIEQVFNWDDNGDIKQGNYQRYCDYLTSVSSVKFNHHLGYTLNGSITGVEVIGPGFEIDWGDGIINNNQTHTYSSVGLYIVKVLNSTSFKINSSYVNNVISFNYNGRSNTVLNSAFRNSISLTNANLNDCNKLTSCTSVFYNCTSLSIGIDLNNFDNVVNMSQAFQGSAVTSLDNLNIPNCTNLHETFKECSSLTGSLPSFENMTNVTTMYHTFLGTGLSGTVPSFSTFNNLTNLNATFLNSNVDEITDLDLQNCTLFQSAFRSTNITYIPTLANMSNVVNMQYSFAACPNLIGNVDLSVVMNTVTNWQQTFEGSTGLGTNDGVTPFYNVTEIWSNPPNTNLQNVTNFINCFANTNFLNQASIPTDWK